MKTRILCYGDSNTWGYTPGSGERFDENTRWTGRLQKALGNAVQIIEAGMNARTTSFTDPFKDYLNGRQGLPYSLVEGKPLDCLVISLGTNDLKYGNAVWSAKGLDALLEAAVNANACYTGSSPVFPKGTKILVISPIHLHDLLDEKTPDSVFFGKVSQSHRFAELYRAVAEKHQVEFLDAAQYASASEVDCVHMDAESHGRLAEAVAEKLRQMLQI